VETQSFLGRLPRKDTPVHIIGAGFAGLSCAFYLKKAGIPFSIYEKSSRAGGMLGTTMTPYGPAESAANGFIWCNEIAELADTLGVKLQEPVAAARKRYIVRNGRLRIMPLSFWEILKTLKRAHFSKVKDCETLEDFGIHYLGEAATRQLLSPGMAGIYGAPLNELSFQGSLPSIYKVSQQPGSLLMNLRRFLKEKRKAEPVAFKGTWSFENGMQTMIDAMAAYVGEHIRYEFTLDISTLPADEQVIICMPAYESARLFAHDEQVSNLLNRVRYLPLIAATLFFEKDSFTKIKTGFGCLIPAEEGYASRGILFNHDIYPGRVQNPAVYSLTFVVYPGKLQGGIDASDEEVLAACHKDAAALLGNVRPALGYYIARWHSALPVYSPEHLQVIRELHDVLCEKHPHVSLLANYTGEIALRGMIRSASHVCNN
jgi:protoporphyrinogen/coproporphyrinogen III oxidase